jgi:hypothetical protein
LDGELVTWNPSEGRLNFPGLQARMTAGKRIRTVATSAESWESQFKSIRKKHIESNTDQAWTDKQGRLKILPTDDLLDVVAEWQRPEELGSSELRMVRASVGPEA